MFLFEVSVEMVLLPCSEDIAATVQVWRSADLVDRWSSCYLAHPYYKTGWFGVTEAAAPVEVLPLRPRQSLCPL